MDIAWTLQPEQCGALRERYARNFVVITLSRYNRQIKYAYLTRAKKTWNQKDEENKSCSITRFVKKYLNLVKRTHHVQKYNFTDFLLDAVLSFKKLFCFCLVFDIFFFLCCFVDTGIDIYC